jgi:hypothetical protein
MKKGTGELKGEMRIKFYVNEEGTPVPFYKLIIT